MVHLWPHSTPQVFLKDHCLTLIMWIPLFSLLEISSLALTQYLIGHLLQISIGQGPGESIERNTVTSRTWLVHICKVLINCKGYSHTFSDVLSTAIWKSTSSRWYYYFYSEKKWRQKEQTSSSRSCRLVVLSIASNSTSCDSRCLMSPPCTCSEPQVKTKVFLAGPSQCVPCVWDAADPVKEWAGGPVA